MSIHLFSQAGNNILRLHNLSVLSPYFFSALSTPFDLFASPLASLLSSRGGGSDQKLVGNHCWTQS